MDETPDKEDKLIRMLLIGAAGAAVTGLLLFATLVTVMISYNFNILEWME